MTEPNARFLRKKPDHLAWEWLPGTSLIWHPDEVETHYEKPTNSFCRFRKSFDIPEIPVKGELRIFADFRYQLFVNGHYVGRGPCRSDPRWQYYDVINIAPWIRQGRNTISVFVLFLGYGNGQSISRIPALLAEARVLTNAGAIHVPCDSTWKCEKANAYESHAPRVNGCQGPVEIVDARLDDGDWIHLDYDDANWISVKSRGVRLTPYWNLVPRSIPLLQEEIIDSTAVINRGVLKEHEALLEQRHKQIIAEIAGIEITHIATLPPTDLVFAPAVEGTAHVATYDFGRIEPGYLQLEVTGTSGTVIDVVYAEELWEGKALLNKDNHRSFDTFILREGYNSFEVAFGWKACRYIQLRMRNPQGEAIVHRIGMRKRTYPVTQHAVFACSDEKLQRIWDISEHTLRICMQDAFVDSPSREQQQWMGDGRWQALMNYYYTGDSRMHRKLLEQIGQSQDWHGMTTSRYPDGHHNLPPIPSFCLQWVCSFDDYLFHTGDKQLISEWWPNIVQALRWFTAFENTAGLLSDVPYWSYIDLGESPSGVRLDSGRGGAITALNLQYLEALQKAARYATIVQDVEATAYFDKRAATLADSIRLHLWCETAGTYVDCLVEDKLSNVVSEVANALALLYLHPIGSEKSEGIYERVFTPAATNDTVIGGPYSMLMISRALAGIGQSERAIELIRKRYAPMVESGATTVWEHWKLFYQDPKSGEVHYNSACHAWASAPLVIFTEELVGIKPLAPGFSRVAIQPNLCGLQWVEGSVVTSDGELTVRAERQGDDISVQFTVPAGCEAICMGRAFGEGTHEVMTMDHSVRGGRSQ
jgi:alpha-L-rhamnosidase